MTSTVLITGCSSGFGAAAARAFAGKGWNVVATARRPEDVQGLAREPGILVTRLDVQDRASIDTAVAAGIERFGRIDALVNNAGFGLFGLFETTSREKIQEQFDVNLFGAMDVTRALLPHFRANRDGVIVNVSSGAGVFALPMISLYCASKFALEGFSESLAYELADLGIRVKIVEPGGVTTTRFGERSASEAGAAGSIADYQPFLDSAHALFDRLRQSRGRATSEEVAEVIVEATLDRTNRLRYVATEDIKPMVAARRETSEDAYRAFMREALGLDHS
ncbi:SDR family oxidoreductase [Ancylobacter amanitiformis]|uniref:NAD(P)-dependent dehydrogenase (Short-subunit alcohol dehydrogenase family) n=1 Tax=Ancylobacter amanitiformis TaxID=217069 RepID=A0ABU0LUT0_9HYPH|nr:SDR family oxidoreductase [Ancylobacter amanitiformis]MDQ0512479.1 NAD(P)-dependent dehydrogenase (short-subunit alcohol dehydrogenase family) [Ancylobacter amanitiformis]